MTQPPRENEDASLRGPLSEVFLAALLEGKLRELEVRLGAQATLGIPGCAIARGPSEVTALLQTLAGRFKREETRFDIERTLSSLDRDVTAGILSMAAENGPRTTARILLACEKKPDRKIALRLYAPSPLVFGTEEAYERVADERIAASGSGIGKELAWALETRDFSAFLKLFELNATFESGDGSVLRTDAPTFVESFEALLALDLAATSSMDAGDAAVVETWSALRSDRVAFLGQRGPSSLIGRLRVFGPA
jgi:hypothetical protein